MSTFSGPTSRLMASSVCSAICSVRSMRVPAGARRCNWNCPVSTTGKISVPSAPPDQENDCAADDQIGKHDDPPSFHDDVREPLVLGAHPVEERLLRLAMRAR